MKKIYVLLFLSLILGGCSLLFRSTGPAPTSLVAGQTVQLDFPVKDREGNDLVLSDYKGKKIYINFWATWCGPCLREIPELEEVYQEYKDNEGYVFLSLTAPNDRDYGNTTADTDTGQILAKAEELGISYPVLFDYKNQAASQFGLAAFPTHIFINSDGKLSVAYIGQVQKEKLIELLEGME